MADKNVDPTDPSDPSATPEPSGEELMHSGDNTGSSDPDVVQGELQPVEEEQLEDILGDDSLDMDESEFDDSTDADREPEPALLGSRRPVRKSAVNAETETSSSSKRRKKQTATPKQRREDEEEPRTSPPEFVRQSVSELKKVVWPTGEQVRGYFVVVLVFVLAIIAYVSVLDLGFGWLLLKVFGS